MSDQQALVWRYQPSDPEPERTHPAQELRDALRRGQPVEIESAVVHGDLDLKNLEYPHKLAIRDTVFTGRVDFGEARFARSVDLSGCHFQREVSFFGVRIDGQLSLGGAKIAKGIQQSAVGNFAHLEVAGPLNASGLESEVGLSLVHATIGASAALEGVKIQGDLDLELATIGGHLSCRSQRGRRTEIAGRLVMGNATLRGEVRLDGARIGVDARLPDRPEAVLLASAVVEGHVWCNPTDEYRTEVLGELSFYGAKLGGDVSLVGVKLGREADTSHPCPIPGKLNLRNVQIEGNLFCQPAGRHRTEVLGTVSLFEARVGGLVVLDGIRIGPEARSRYDEVVPGKLILQDAAIGGSLYCRAVEDVRAEIAGSVSLLRTRVGGSVAFQGAKIGREAQGPDLPPIPGRLDLSDAQIAGDVFCNPMGVETLGPSHRTEVLGPVLLWGASIGGDVFFDGVKIGREAQSPDIAAVPGELNLRDADVLGDLLAGSVESRTAEHSFRAEVYGPVSLVGARIDGQVVLMGARIGAQGPPSQQGGGPQLNLQSATITGGLFCGPQGSYATEIHGDVRTFAADMRCAVEFDRTQIHGDLDMERTAIAGPLLCAFDEQRYAKAPDDASRHVPGHFQVDGIMKLTGAQAQDVVIDGRLFGGRRPLAGLSARLIRPLVWLLASLGFLLRLCVGQRERSVEQARLRLDRARIAKLQFKEALPHAIHADGVALADLELPGPRPFEYTELLRRTHPYRKSTYLALESLLVNKGLDGQAARVYIAMCNRDLLLGRNVLDRWFRWLLLGLPIGYGARSSRLFWFILLTFLLSVWVFSSPDSLVSYRPDQPAAACPLPAGEPGWETTLLAALECHFPMFRFIRGNPYYVASTNPIREIPELLGLPGLQLTYRMYALAVSALSWVVVPLWLAGLTGLVRRRR